MLKKKSWIKLCALGLLSASVLLAGCQKEMQLPPTYPVQNNESQAEFLRHLKPSNQHLTSWRALAPSVQKSLRYVKAKKQEAYAIDRMELRLTWGQLRQSLEELERLLPALDANPALFAQHFTWLPMHEGMKYTGYYEPVIEASRTYKPGYQAIYKAPPELAKVRRQGRKFHSREAIDKDMVLAGRGLELAWAKSQVDVFYLQIQGSGKLVFEDGSSVYVNYAGQNGHKYVSSGRVMKDLGLVERGDIYEQRQWFAENPEETFDILKQNPSYVFFRFGNDGAIGAMGSVVEPYISLASDRKFIPLGSIVAYGVNIPSEASGTKPLRGIGLPQDVGGAIKQNRFDVFVGGGVEAIYVASHLDARGPAWVLVSKSALGSW